MRRRGNMLALVLVVTLIAGLLGAALMQRASRSLHTGEWSRDHLALRLLAESAVQEELLALEQDANDPAAGAFTALRAPPAGGRFAPFTLSLARPSQALDDAKALEVALGGAVKLEVAATVARRDAVSSDPLEWAGVVRLDATARLARRSVTERVRMERALLVSRYTVPTPLDGAGFYVAHATPDFFRALPAGKPVLASARGAFFTFRDLVTGSAPEDFHPQPPEQDAAAAQAVEQLSSATVLSQRAHYVTTSKAQFDRFLADRVARKVPLNGVWHHSGRDAVRLELPAFRGRCLISAEGPVEVRDVKVDDPARDCLTVVSQQRILITGRTVQASLVCVNESGQGITMGQRAAVLGSIVAKRFPQGTGLTGPDLANSQVQLRPELDPGAGAAPDAPAPNRYFAGLSPYPLRLQHRRDSEDWAP